MARVLPGQKADDMPPLGALRLTGVESWAGRALLRELFRHAQPGGLDPKEKAAFEKAGEEEDDYHAQLSQGPAYSLNDVVVKLAYAVRWLSQLDVQEGGFKRLAFDAVATSLSDTILLRAAAMDQREPSDDEGPL